ncbi:MAG: type I-C CRISPR-associated endonuclease Cas1c [Acetatifactor sp.]|nr:type I-C CRISPR-associated endonuclease Cas1c [Acetatifactor sp.]
MKKLLNTLYVTSPDTYLGLDGENVIVKKEDAVVLRIPIHNLEAIVAFNYVGASPALMRKCGEQGVSLSFFQGDRFCGRFVGQENGNVILRKTQYRVSDNEQDSLKIAKNMILGKVHNARYVVDRALRDHALRLDCDRMQKASQYLKQSLRNIKESISLDQLRGLEGEAASIYFGVFDELILQQKKDFMFSGRNKRPPLDNVNALLSFAYSLLTSECAGAAYSVGLDPYVGFLHRDRPGRQSLALDLMEELRAPVADRFVLTLINKQEIAGKGFKKMESGAVLLNDETRRLILQKWQESKKEQVQHPFLKEKVQIGLLPYVQAMLLARYLRGDIDAYSPYFKR